MKNQRFTKKALGALTLSLIMFVTLTTFARGESPTTKAAGKKGTLRERVRADISQSRDQKEPAPASQDELERLRTSLLDLAGALREFTQLAPDHFDVDRLDEATALVGALTYEQLAKLRKTLNPGRMGERLAVARSTIAEYRSGIQSQSAGDNKAKKSGGIRIATAGFPDAHPFCTDAKGDHVSRLPVAVLLAADVLYFVAETIRDLAQDGCNEVIVILGEGGNGRLVCIGSDTLYVIAHAVWEGIHFCNEELTDAIVDANYERLFHIHEDLEASLENDNANKTMIIANDNSNTTSINTNVNTKFTSLSNQISAGTTEILNKIESKGNQIINNDNTNKTMIINNDNTNTANIITNDNANKTTIINNDNANFAATINEMRALNCDVIRLLHTPDGQRSSDIASCAGKPGFPYRWNKLTSTPVTPASAKVSAGTDTNPVTDPFSNERGQDGVPILPLMGTVTLERHLLEGRLIPTYYLPASRGGMIELVKLLVWNTIGAQLELDIAKAETEEAKGLARQADELLAKKKYLEAYRQYSVAYQRLVPAN